MTFERWAKELLCDELKNQGTTYYIKKPSARQGWYCVTPTGFLLHVKAEKGRNGFFGICYEIMPLIGKLLEYPKIFSLTRPLPVGMGTITDMALLYTRKFGLDYCNDECSHLRSAEIDLPKTRETAEEMIRNYLNPLFDSLSSYESYCKAAIEIELYVCERDKVKRRQMAQLLFDCGLDAGVDREDHCSQDSPIYYPWYARHTTAMPYVYAALGKYEAALAHIRAIREMRMKTLTNAYERGDYAKRTDVYWERMDELKRDDNEIEMAMQANDAELVKEILEKNYRRNKEIVHKQLGIDLPETCNISTDKGIF